MIRARFWRIALSFLMPLAGHHWVAGFLSPAPGGRGHAPIRRPATPRWLARTLESHQRGPSPSPRPERGVRGGETKKKCPWPVYGRKLLFAISKGPGGRDTGRLPNAKGNRGRQRQRRTQGGKTSWRQWKWKSPNAPSLKAAPKSPQSTNGRSPPTNQPKNIPRHHRLWGAKRHPDIRFWYGERGCA